jgi:hypothetical protein
MTNFTLFVPYMYGTNNIKHTFVGTRLYIIKKMYGTNNIKFIHPLAQENQIVPLTDIIEFKFKKSIYK